MACEHTVFTPRNNVPPSTTQHLSKTHCRQRADVHYQFVAVDFLPPPILGDQMQRLAARLAAGALRPLRAAAYPLSAAAAAMRLLAQASHVGKVVTVAPPAPLLTLDSPKSKASVMITGGGGGLGLLIARWLATTGQARRVVLVGRSGRLGRGGAAAGGAAVEMMTGCDMEVSLVAADMSCEADATAAWGRCGDCDVVLHAAGVLQVSERGMRWFCWLSSGWVVTDASFMLAVALTTSVGKIASANQGGPPKG